MDYDDKIKLRCTNCGGFFEFMPGFGAFTLPEEERRGSVRHEGSAFRPHYETYESDVPFTIERPPARDNECGSCCGVAVFCCCILPIMMFVLSFIFGFGFLWFWLW
jgi:hypothetical protein